MTSRYRRCPRRLRRHKNKNALTVRPQFPRVAGKDFSTPWPSWRGLSPTGNREEETTWLEEPFNGWGRRLHWARPWRPRPRVRSRSMGVWSRGWTTRAMCTTRPRGALAICGGARASKGGRGEIGRGAGRERGANVGGAGAVKKKKKV